MFDLKASASGGYRRIEVLTDPGRRRRWSAEDKARVIAESLVAGASPSEIARRWQICPQQLFTWRRQAGAVADVVESLGGVISGSLQRAMTGVGTPAEITPWDRIAR